MTFHSNTVILCTSILFTMMFATASGEHQVNATIDKTKFVEYYPKNWDDAFCQQGIYNPKRPGSVDGSVKCCKGKLLLGPFYVLVDEDKDFREVKLPDYTNCDYNMTIENGNDDFGTLMWRIYACKMKSILGKSEKEIDFKTFVEFRTIKYTKDLQQLIRDGMSKEENGCQGDDKEINFLKKVEKYFWCFQKLEQNICEAPTTDAQITLNRTLEITRISNSRLNVTCPLILPGTRFNDFCCNGVSTPSPWLARFNAMISVDFPQDTFPNGTTVEKKSYSDCMATSENLMTTNNTEDTFSQSCYSACVLNPVTFSTNGSSVPEVELEFGPLIMDKYLSWFNTKAKNAIQKFVNNMAKTRRISTNEKQSREQNGIKFEDAGEAFKRLTNPKEKAMLYCAYYKEVDDIMTSSSSALCTA